MATLFSTEFLMQTQYLINGKRDHCLSPLDRGFSYGDGVFRTFRFRQGEGQCWELHYARLREDCNRLGIVCPSANVILNDIHSLCSQNDDVVLKIIVTRGESARGYAVPALAQPNRVVIKSAMPDYPASHFSEGVNLHLCQTRLSIQPRLAGIKHLNRLENVLARMEWTDTQVADGLLLDVDGNVIECTMSNLFLRCGDRLVTPDLGRCGVAGVTRQRIMALAPTLGYAAEVDSFNLDVLNQADELVICNSLYGAWQVRRLNGASWPAGELAERLRHYLEKNDAIIG